MAPKRNTQHTNEAPTNEWAELRRTLMDMQANIQATITNSIQELAETMLQNNQSRQGLDSDSDETLDNPFAGGKDQRRQLQEDLREEDGNTGDRNWELGFKVEIPEFHGGARGDELLDWLVAVDEAMEFKQVPDHRKVPVVATKFRGRAASWWLQLKATRARTGKSKIKTWEKLHKQLRLSFLPQNYDRTMYTRLQNLRQGSRTVDDYADEFSLLITSNEIFDSEIQLVSRFIGGLRPQIQNALMQFDPMTIAEAQSRAIAFEQQFKSNSSWSSTSRNRPTITDGGATIPNMCESEDTGGGRLATTNPSSDSQQLRRSTKSNVLRCFSCGEAGHIQTACPTKTRRGLFTDEVKWDDEGEEGETPEDDVLAFPETRTSGDQGTMLVARSCFSPVASEDPYLRTNIFQSTCTIKSKVCQVVIDSGSSQNVVSEEACRKLGLRRENHPRLYVVEQGG
ncbi:unnamed protein product [Microthlaspi erraticum]|uniref:CCHC-type domain-containing protein n=1 Tax=Microthlaspi erraticum TaxID=1685480 RepID=A0A6D2IJF9_9BRAS|nr:unnamed protein product [Microthlaspi erraticum]